MLCAATVKICAADIYCVEANMRLLLGIFQYFKERATASERYQEKCATASEEENVCICF